MTTKKAKKAAPVRKKAVAKKAAPVRKKAVAKKAAPVPKKAVAKKAVAKKAAPVRKKAVAKKAAPVRKKAVAKKAAPVRKKAVAKKAAPVRKKAVAKKAAPVRVKKIEFSNSVSLPSVDKPWLEREQELPVFLKDVKSEIRKEPISTQGYVKKKSRKPILVGFSSVVLLLGIAAVSISTQSSTNTKSETQKTIEVTSSKDATKKTVTEEVAPTTEPSKSSSIEKPSKATLSSFAPRNFASTSAGQEINFVWLAPADSSSVIGYELSAKKSGATDWVVISSVTPQQLLVSVELMSLDSTSQYRIASILESGKIAFSKAVLSHAGAID
jgi:hypothetical protein